MRAAPSSVRRPVESMKASSERSSVASLSPRCSSAWLSCGSETRSSSPPTLSTIPSGPSSTVTSKRGGRKAPGSGAALITVHDASNGRRNTRLPMRALVNAAYAPGAVPAPVADAWAFHQDLEGYTPTPVRSLGEGVWLKDESDRLGLPAFKVLGVSWAVERALRSDPHVKTLVAASAGNHGRAVAHVAARRGLLCRIVLPARSGPARREAIESEGADVEIVDGSYEDAVQRA